MEWFEYWRQLRVLQRERDKSAAPYAVLSARAGRKRRPRLVSTLLATALALAGCGVDIPATEDVKVVVGETLYTIPSNYFLAPPGYDGEVAGIRRASGFVLVGAAPEFEGRSSKNGKQFQESGHTPRIYVHVLNAPVGARRAMEGRLKLYQSEGSVVSEARLGSDRHMVLRRTKGFNLVSSISDLFISDSGEFTLCSRLEPPHKSAACTAYFEDGDQLYEVRLGRDWMDHRNVLVDRVKYTVNSWKNPA